MTSQLEELASVAARYGLYLDPDKAITDGVPPGWVLLPRHWGRGMYDFTFLPPCGHGFSGGPMERYRKALKIARKTAIEHVCASCARIERRLTDG